MTEPEPPRTLPRRRVLAVGAGVALLAVSGSSLLTGCRSTQTPSLPAPPPTPTPDEVLRRRAVARITAVRDAVARLGAPAALAPLPADLSAACATQLAALGEAPATPSGTSTPGGPGSPTGSAGPATSTSATPTASTGTASTGTASTGTASTSTVSTSTASTSTASTGTASTSTVTPVPATPADIVAAQLAAASEALRDCSAAGAPGLAVLLARLAAGHAAGADLLSAAAHLPAPGTVVPAPAITAGSATASTSTASTSTASTTTTTPAGTSATTQAGASSPAPSLDTEQVGALTRLLQGEHAAAYAYGVVTAWVAPPLRERAHLFWSDHLTDRDTLEQLLTASGASAPAASAAYDLGALPTGSPAAVTLAANVEGRLAALAASAVGAGPQSRRLFAAELLIGSARRQSAWTSAVSALPGG
jgi:Domain of unknown function (DUF4439)